VLVARQRSAPAGDAIDALGVLGASEAIDAVRDQIRKVAGVGVPVLITGESGTGKELVARSIVASSARRDRPFVAVNLAALPPSLAASELFGHVKGAFTGADRAREGLFEQAEGGTLFLDEIGDAPSDVQVALLRVLETSELRPVGGSSAKTVDVRLITATDADLDGAIKRGSFRQALLERIAGYRIALAPLRDRREDVGLLLEAFVRSELRSVGMEAKLQPSEEPWLAAGLVARLALASWPGNVRQLRNAARQIVISNRDRDRVRLDPILERQLARDVPARAEPPRPTGLPDDDDELVAILREHKFELRRVARELGVSRSTLYARIDKSDKIRKARDLTKEMIESARAKVGDDLETLAGELEVSPRGLQLRLRELG
jgi:two-component system nitrogen regulation response regulator GlnG